MSIVDGEREQRWGNAVGDIRLARWGNAYEWADHAAGIGYPVDSTPTPGAVAWWGVDDGKGKYGHVGVVREVRADGTIVVEESAWGSSLFSVQTYRPGDPGYPGGFLHVPAGFVNAMSQTFGADADELDRLAAAFRQAADELDADGSQLTQLLNNVAWMGDVAGRFVGDWTGVRVPQIGLSTRFLRDAAAVLAANAAEQRRASGGASGSIGAIPRIPPRPAEPPEQDEDRPEVWDALEGALTAMGLASGAVNAVIDGLTEFLGPDQVQELLDNLLTPGFVSAFKLLDQALDLSTALVSMARDFGEHAHLPMDERLVHAVTVASIGFAASKGVEAAVTWAMTALGSVVPVLGTGVGMVAGKVIGFALAEGIEWGLDKLDDAYDVTGQAADLVVEGYRRLEDFGGDVVDVIGGAVEVVGSVGDAVVDGATDVIGAVGDAGGAVVDGVSGFVGGLFD
jgi:surface antigen